jgi:hypothetical protein
MADYRLFARNPDLSKDSEIANYSELEYVSKYCLAGRWKLSGQGEIPLTYQQGIFVERDGQVVFSGLVRKIEKEMNAAQAIDRKWTVTGIDDLGRLNERVAHPDPGGLTITLQTYDTRTGAAETVITNYVSYNCGALAVAARQFANFQTATSSGRGSTVTGNARFFDLLDFIYNLAKQGGVGYQVRYDSGLNRLVFEITMPTDRTNSVMFSTEFGNLQQFKYTLSGPKVNFVWVLGQDTTISRGYASATDANSVTNWGRIEAVKDQRNEPDDAKLAEWGAQEIAENKEQEGFGMTTLPLGEVGFVYSVDYFLGDLVSVADDGQVLEDTVTEVNVKLKSNGEEIITPTIGKMPDVPLRATLDKITDLEKRVEKIEVSQ